MAAILNVAIIKVEHLTKECSILRKHPYFPTSQVLTHMILHIAGLASCTANCVVDKYLYTVICLPYFVFSLQRFICVACSTVRSYFITDQFITINVRGNA